MNNYFSNLDEILAEKERLRKRIRRQEKMMYRDWESIEDSWRVVSKVAGATSTFFSSSGMITGVGIGYRLLSHLFLKRRKAKSLKD